MTGAARYRILIVDDEEDIRTLLKSFLGRHFEVVQAKNGLDALLKLPKYDVDLAIIDIMMPLMDGLTLAKKIRAMPGHETLPLIALSALDSAEDIKAGYAAGTEAYLTKPFDPDRVLKNVTVSLQGAPVRPKRMTVAEIEEREAQQEERKTRALSKPAITYTSSASVPKEPPARKDGREFAQRVDDDVPAPPSAAKTAPVAAPKAPVSSPLAAPSGQKPRVMLVDDDEDLLNLLRSALEPEFEVVTAHNGIEALNRIPLAEPDCYVIDGMMPKMSGYQFLDALRSAADTRSKPVVFSSAKNHPKDRAMVRARGVEHYLTKPYDPKDLADTVRKIFASPGHTVAPKQNSIQDLQMRELQQKEREERTVEKKMVWRTYSALEEFLNQNKDRDPFGKEDSIAEQI